MLTIENAQLTDAKFLTELTLRSKDYWNYGSDLMEEWRESLTVTSSYIASNKVIVLKQRGTIIGYYSVVHLAEAEVELDNLFIDPIYIGNGHGDRLMKHFLDQQREKGTVRITLYSDPNAEAFYTKYGFKVIGRVESSQPGRFLPTMERTVIPDK